jgi:hypothetical protein
MDQMIEIFEAMSFSDKVSANERIAAIIRKEGGGKTSKTSKKAKGSKTSDEPKEKEKTKRKCAPGTLAWQAYVKHVKATQPDAFEGIKKESEKLTVIKGIRAADEESYDAWVAAWIVDYKAAEGTSSASSDAEEADADADAEPVPVPAPVPAPKKTAAERVAELKAKKAASEAPASKPAAPVKEKKEKKPVKAVKKTEEPQMAQREIDGVMYWHEPETNALWEVTGENFADGAVWTGYFQPGNEEEPIRCTDGLGQ